MGMRTEFDDDQDDTAGVVDLHRRIRGVVAAVVVLSRLASLTMVALSVIAAAQVHAYTSIGLAVAVYASVGGWSAVLILTVVRRDPIPGWVLVVDVAVTSAGVLALPLAVDNPVFAPLASPYLEPITVGVAVAVALISGSARLTALGCAVLAVTYAVGQAPHVSGASGVVSIVTPIAWQVGTSACCYVFVQRLRQVAVQVDVATARVIADRERVAAARAHTEERARQFREQVRRYRALHDGPLRILTAVAGPGPAGHPDPEVRRQCAVSVNVLRGATPDESGGNLTDLSLALVEAGADSAAYGLRVEYHFANLPEDLPPSVVDALAKASGEALSNVAVHAGTTKARLTALSGGDRDSDPPAVTVAIVDQGKGFDPAVAEHGYGIRHSIIGRMADVGGTATVDSHPGEGTRIDLRWPA